jgi:diadenosine tetraphosphate (Ap4A) HIT family hydrolase
LTPWQTDGLTFEELVAFVRDKMTMSHVYQPLVIRALLDADGAATLRQLAVSLASQDEAVLIEAEKTLVNMPLRVLSNHNVLRYDKKNRLATLTTPKLSLEQKATIRSLCEKQLGDYLAKRGLRIWDYRLIDDTAVPYDLRYQVLAESDRRCALCGATEKQRPLDVDHIIPRSLGGRNDKSNLQVLCSRCNRAKGNRDRRDFRTRVSEVEPGCPFCPPNVATRIVAESDHAVALADGFPVTDGHTLIVPRRHVSDPLDMTQAEQNATHDLLRALSRRLRAADTTIEGFTIGQNAGPAAGQTVMHAHTHLIPRRRGDVEDPTGGVRNVIPGRGRYE